MRASRGITLLEMLLVVALGGFVLSLVSFLLSRPKQMLENVSTALEESALADIEGRQLVERFNRSFVMRRGYVFCGSRQPGPLLQDRQSADVAEAELALPFSLGFSLYSTMGAVVGTDRVAMTSLDKIAVGSLIILSSVNHPTLGGVYQVTALDPDLKQVKIASPSQPPADFGCEFQNSLPLSEFLADDRNKVFGVPVRSFRLDVLKLVKYTVEKEAKQQDALMQAVWPSGVTGVGDDAGPAIRKTVALRGFKSMSIEGGSWRPQVSAGSSSGIFNAQLLVRHEEPSIGGKQPILKTSLNTLFYSTTTGSAVNFGAVTTPQTVDLRFPTCSLVLSPYFGRLSRDDDKFALMYQMRAFVTDLSVPARIDVSMTSTSPRPVMCWRETQVVQGAQNRLQVPVPTGQTGSTMIAQKSDGSWLTLYCDVWPGSSLSGDLVYFHEELGVEVRKACSPAEVRPRLMEVSFLNSPASCRQDGSIDLAPLVFKNTQETAPQLYIGGCQWSSTSKTECTPNPAYGQLLAVTVLPTEIPGNPLPTDNRLDCVP